MPHNLLRGNLKKRKFKMEKSIYKWLTIIAALITIIQFLINRLH